MAEMTITQAMAQGIFAWVVTIREDESMRRAMRMSRRGPATKNQLGLTPMRRAEPASVARLRIQAHGDDSDKYSEGHFDQRTDDQRTEVADHRVADSCHHDSKSDHLSTSASLLDDVEEMEESPSIRDTIESLRARMRQSPSFSSPEEVDLVSTGCADWDRWLPAGGFPRGALVEWFGVQAGGGAGTLALQVAREACASGGWLVVIDSERNFYPPAALAHRIDLHRLIVLRPANRQDLYWSVQQALACPAVGAVWGALDSIDEIAFRRFQLAAESSGCLGMFLRPAAARGLPSWSELQLGVEPQRSGGLSEPHLRPLAMSRRFHVTMLRGRQTFQRRRIGLELNELTGRISVLAVAGAESRGGMTGGVAGGAESTMKGQSHEQTHSMHLAAQLAHPKISRREARA
jgi:protein ImuA